MKTNLSHLLLTLTTLSALVHASPPPPTVTCSAGDVNCIVTNGYGIYPDRTTCKAASVARPADESELLSVVSDASQKKQHMKVVTVYSHSIPKLSCPGGPDGEGLVISTENLNSVMDVDPLRVRMTVGGGITLRGLIDAAAENGLALPHSPYWEGMTLGGLIGTGSHGSSLSGKGPAVHEYVVGVRLVVPSTSAGGDGKYARVVGLVEGDEELLAAKVSLGVLGVISQVTLQLEPMFKRSITNRVEGDDGFENQIAAFGSMTEFGDITWYPSQGRVVFRDDFRVPITTKGIGLNDFTGFRAQPRLIIEGIRTTGTHCESLTTYTTHNPSGKCVLSKGQVTVLLESGLGLKNRDGSLLEFTGYPVIGNQSDMQTSGSCLNGKDDLLLTACGWDRRIHGLRYHQTTVSIPLTNITSFISDVKKLRDINRDSLCGVELYSGFLMRFIKASTAYLGKTADSVDIDITYYRSNDPLDPRLDEDVLEEIEQMALFKYKGMPHLGKNRNVGFVGMREKLGAKGDLFVKAMEKYDPEGLFSSDWTDAVLGLRGKALTVEKKGCALEGLCICSRDEHCAPEKGYLCRPGMVYTESRVCRREDDGLLKMEVL
ncbi:hypothetical protein QJS04_geneDACA024087 [Acorus gramineus]|uniref:L-gulonolactone oxidase n=1 Tax=Acorus gramineus TaxID=55184 RepID=A0AAV9AYT5_ACOGR|nr:hypothetical protein QJS04_geneDACA024087 [Acorus gramineus]